MTKRLLYLLALILLPFAVSAQEPKAKPRLEFTRMVAHWAKYDGPDYLPFIKDAQPELAQFGFYGGHFWSLAHTPQYKGYPAHFPVQGLNECGDWFQQKNKALHKMDVKVIGHFNMEFLVGEPDGPNGPRGFFKFYNELWDEKELGPKPVQDPMEFLERNVKGEPIIQHAYKIGGMPEYWACLRNPAWQTVLKAWVKRGIERGLDGFIANYFYRHDCHCEHCQRGFKSYLSNRFTEKELRKQFGIANLKSHKFEEIVYWHRPDESTPLRREMLRWSQISNKEVFDEVFLKYGRSLKPDLITAQWNHLGNFSQISGDERCLLPAEQWGKGESYLWYSAGGSANATDLEQGNLGDVTLQARYIRGAFDDKPFTVGKYENTRIRSAISELAANGGAPMGFYTRFTDPNARREIVRYYQFLKRYNTLFHQNRSHAEVVLLFPRKSVHAGNLEAVKKFVEIGKTLLEKHILFDVLPDDLASEEKLTRYRQVYLANQAVAIPEGLGLSQINAPKEVRVSATRPIKGHEITLHFVNYNREEPPKAKNGSPSPGRGIQEEKPIAVTEIKVKFQLPKDAVVAKLEFLTPEQEQPTKITFEQREDRLNFTVPEFLVYGIVRVYFNP